MEAWIIQLVTRWRGGTPHGTPTREQFLYQLSFLLGKGCARPGSLHLLVPPGLHKG